MNRIVFVDIETTGLLIARDRIIEIGCVEVVNRILTGKTFHYFVNPGIRITPEASKIHGIHDSFLSNAPSFGYICDQFLSFIHNSPIIAHNAPFDKRFITKELSIHKRSNNLLYKDSLKIFRKLYPNKKNSLSAICKRLNIKRTRSHSAIYDALDLAKAYLIATNKQRKLI
ncbi:exonuclease domain-containing protein [Candidatus Vidania fulgoroideorum]